MRPIPRLTIHVSLYIFSLLLIPSRLKANLPVVIYLKGCATIIRQITSVYVMVTMCREQCAAWFYLVAHYNGKKGKEPIDSFYVI